jgi:hypothetical protein
MTFPSNEYLEEVARLGAQLLERRAAVERAEEEYEQAAAEMRAAIARATEPRTEDDDLEDAVVQIRKAAATHAPSTPNTAGTTPDDAKSMRDRALVFVNSHPGTVFTASEIGPQIGVSNLDSLRTTLSNLANDGEILRGEKRGEYTAKALKLVVMTAG